MGFIDSLIFVNIASDVVIIGKIDFTYCNNILSLSEFSNFLRTCTCKDISFCDNLLGQYSYVSESLGNVLTDHVLMSNNLKSHPIQP